MKNLTKLQDRLKTVEKARNTTGIFKAIEACELAEETLATKKPFHAIKTWNGGYVVGDGHGKYVRIAKNEYFWELTYHGQYGADDEYATLAIAKDQAVGWLKAN